MKETKSSFRPAFSPRGTFVVFAWFIILTGCDPAQAKKGNSGQQQQKPSCRIPSLLNGHVERRANGWLVLFSCAEDFTRYGEGRSMCGEGDSGWSPPPPVCVRGGCPPPPAVRNGRAVSAARGGVLRIVCDLGYVLIDGGDIVFCDGYRWNSTDLPACRPSPLYKHPWGCNFENPGQPLCGWMEDPARYFSWVWYASSRGSGSGTGPRADHTHKDDTGHYMYIEATGNEKIRDSRKPSRLISPVMDKSLAKSDKAPGACLSFWYYMNGTAGGSLRFLVKEESKAMDQLEPAIALTGNMGPEWLHGVVALDGVQENFQVIIEGVLGQGMDSDLAIDDVQVTNGANCYQQKPTPPPVNDLSSCSDRCKPGLDESTASFVDCFCFPGCVWNGEGDFPCCPDYNKTCSATTPSPPPSEASPSSAAAAIPAALETTTVTSADAEPRRGTTVEATTTAASSASVPTKLSTPLSPVATAAATERTATVGKSTPRTSQEASASSAATPAATTSNYVRPSSAPPQSSTTAGAIRVILDNPVPSISPLPTLPSSTSAPRRTAAPDSHVGQMTAATRIMTSGNSTSTPVEPVGVTSTPLPTVAISRQPAATTTVAGSTSTTTTESDIAPFPTTPSSAVDRTETKNGSSSSTSERQQQATTISSRVDGDGDGTSWVDRFKSRGVDENKAYGRASGRRLAADADNDDDDGGSAEARRARGSSSSSSSLWKIVAVCGTAGFVAVLAAVGVVAVRRSWARKRADAVADDDDDDTDVLFTAGMSATAGTGGGPSSGGTIVRLGSFKESSARFGEEMDLRVAEPTTTTSYQAATVATAAAASASGRRNGGSGGGGAKRRQTTSTSSAEKLFADGEYDDDDDEAPGRKPSSASATVSGNNDSRRNSGNKRRSTNADAEGVRTNRKSGYRRNTGKDGTADDVEEVENLLDDGDYDDDGEV